MLYVQYERVISGQLASRAESESERKSETDRQTGHTNEARNRAQCYRSSTLTLPPVKTNMQTNSQDTQAKRDTIGALRGTLTPPPVTLAPPPPPPPAGHDCCCRLEQSDSVTQPSL